MRKLLAALFLLWAVPALAQSSSHYYWVSPTGTATWANCRFSSAPTASDDTKHCQLDTANFSVLSGDTVFLRGGTYTLSGGSDWDQGVSPYASGTLVGSTCTATITYQSAPGETPVITGSAIHYGIMLTNRSCIRVSGLTIRDIGSWALLTNADYCELARNTFTSTEPEASMDAGGISLLNGSTHNWLHHNTIGRTLSSSDPCGEGNDVIRVGNAYSIGAVDGHNDYNTIEDNIMFSAAHTVLDNYGAYTVIRRNIFHNEPWVTTCTTGQSGKEIIYDTSASSVAVGTGSKTFTVSAGKSFPTSSPIGIVRTSNHSVAMSGLVVSYSGTTLVVNVLYTTGSGTYSDWTVSKSNFPEYTTPAYDQKFGHRNLQLSDDYNRTGTYVLVESNRIGHASNNPGNGGPMNLDLAAPRNLVRFNDLYNGMSAGVYFKYASADFATPITSSTSVLLGTGTKTFTIQTGLHLYAGMQVRIRASSAYANAMSGTVTSYTSNTGTLVTDITDVAGSGTYAAWDIWWNGGSGGIFNHVYHNTVYHNGYGYNWRAYGYMNVGYAGQGIAQFNSAGTGSTGNVIFGNIIYDNAEGAVCAGGLYDTPCSPETWDTTTGNFTSNPTFVSPTLTDATSTSLPTLTLTTGSSAIDTAGPLTLANGAGTGSTTLVVDDGAFFQDGTRGSDLVRTNGTMHADWIAVGAVTNVAQISSIAGNTLTLKTPLTWSDNASVWLYKRSDGVQVLRGSAPDYGAHETLPGAIVAASCNKADVEAAIALASEGDTISVPPGICTWSSKVTFTKGVSLIGGGPNVTTIIIAPGQPAYYGMLNYEPTLAAVQANSFVRISGFTWDANGNWGGVVIWNTHGALLSNIRVDNNYFRGATSRSLYIHGAITGVADSNTFEDGNVSIEGVGTWAWDNLPRVFGTSQNFYIEDNTYLAVKENRMFASGGAGSLGYITRYNTGRGWSTNHWFFDIHGNQPSSYGYMNNEIYGNDIDLTGYGSGCLFDQRGGQLLSFFNRIYPSGANSQSCSREEYADRSAPFYGFNDYEMHDQNTYVWSNRQTGRADTLIPHLINTDENCCVNVEAWQPSKAYPTNYCTYFTGDPGGNCWKNADGGISGTVEPNWSAVPVQYWTPADGTVYDPEFNGGWVNMGPITNPLSYNVDIWRQTSTGTFDGTGNDSAGGGVGCGPLASRPLTCTTGVGYFATDQSCVDLAGMVGRNPVTPINGRLYKCKATNTWQTDEEAYTPFTYPHPLRAAAPPSAPTNVRIR